MRRAGMLTAFLLAAAPASAASVYTPTTGHGCTDAGSKQFLSAQRCMGRSGFAALLLDEGNLVAALFGPVGGEKALADPDDLTWRGADWAFGKLIEWPMRNGRPYAAILRIRRNDESGTAEELLVVKVTDSGSCRIGSVSAQQRNANAEARKMAATAGATCMRGRRGKVASTETGPLHVKPPSPPRN